MVEHSSKILISEEKATILARNLLKFPSPVHYTKLHSVRKVLLGMSVVVFTVGTFI